MRNVAGMALGLLFMGLGIYGAAAVPPFAFPAAFDPRGYTSNPVALTIMLSITVVFTMFAGWVTARIATDHRRGHALVMATMGLATAIFIGAVRWAAAPSWYHVSSWVLMPVAATIGAAAWERTLRRNSRGDLGRRVAAV